ncbi:MAG TPA: ester cyclase [Luteibacter sp.]|jgi:predicted ester cyclase|uniref:ester cyclase n=1 Tax=Luteibacter sp. TaxID=1886636 RepID=UPI002F3E3B98
MTLDDLAPIYRDYIACLNARDWENLGRFVHADVRHNGIALGLDGYQCMLENDVEQIPDLFFEVRILAVTEPHVAARLWFDVAPKGEFLGLPVNGRKVGFAENVFYAFRDDRIQEVWSIIDKAAIEEQLARVVLSER